MECEDLTHFNHVEVNEKRSLLSFYIHMGVSEFQVRWNWEQNPDIAKCSAHHLKMLVN